MTIHRAAAIPALALGGLALLACGRTGDKAVSTQAGRASAPAQVDDSRIASAASEPQNWLVHGGNQQAHRFSGLDQITPQNIGQLKPAWSMDFDTTRGQEATPIVVDGVIYVTTAWSKVYAVDARTGKALWQYDPQVPGPAAAKNCCDVVSRGAAVYRGRVYVATYDGRLVALDAATGKPEWTAVTVDPDGMYTISGAPRVGGGLVYIGNGGGEFGGRGYVSAYDADTGQLAWRFFTVPGDPSRPDGAASDAIMASLVQPTWSGPHNDYRGGGMAWNSIVYDPEFGQLYFATGNGYPWPRLIRSEGKGDNLFIASVVAVDAKTGAYRWHYQQTPGESWDYDSTGDMILADLAINGAPRKVLMHTPKNGFFYVIDRRDGTLVSAVPFVPGITWASLVDLSTGRPVVAPGAYYTDQPVRLSPGEGGAHGWEPTAYSPQTGFVYLQASANSTTRYIPRREPFEYVKGLDRLGLHHFAQHGPYEPPQTPDPNAPRPESYLLAWDPVAQKEAWKVPGRGGGVLATAGGLVFQGHNRDVYMGELAAHRADTGERVWSHETPNAIITGPVSYAVDGEQYILAASGAGGVGIVAPPQVMRLPQVGRLVAFKLGGTAKLPADPPPAGPVVQVTERFAADDVAKGALVYLETCARCHGLGTRASGILPDLKRSAALNDARTWKAIVEDGSLTGRGMIGWKGLIPHGSAEMIRAYVAGQAGAESVATK
jgi:quinohemoprotein ethanol dehydrogenase